MDLLEIIPTSQSVSLSVDIPADCNAGSTINVLYEDKYYEIVVPEGGPGKTIQVIIQCERSDPDVTIDERVEGDEVARLKETSNEEVVEEPHEEKLSNSQMAMAAGLVVVGTFVMGPIVLGAVAVGGAAYVASKTETAQEINEKYRISERVHTGIATVGEKAKEVDGRFKISDNASVAITSVDNKVKEIDDKYKLSEKTRDLFSQAGIKAQEFDQTYKISEKAAWTAEKITSTANEVATKAVDFDERYQISSKAKSAAEAGIGTIASTWQRLTSRPTTSSYTGATPIFANTGTVPEINAENSAVPKAELVGHNDAPPTIPKEDARDC